MREITMKILKHSIWFYMHLAAVFSGIFLIGGELGWVLAIFSAACAWLIYKIPKPFFSGFQYVETGNSYSDGDDDDSDNEFLGISDNTSPDLDNMMHDHVHHD
jgi:hypothetical protein